VGLRAGLDAVMKRKIPNPYRDSNPPIIQPVAQRYTTETSQLPSSQRGVKLFKRTYSHCESHILGLP
jgi:hypothetical protein